MKILMYSTKKFESVAFENALKDFEGKISIQLTFVEAKLTPETTLLSTGHEAVCLFVTDLANRECLQKLSDLGVKLILLRSAGFNHVDCEMAKKLNIKVLRVPRYSPEAIAEFTVGLYLCLNRKIHRAHNRVREGNFSIEGLMGHNISGQTIGVVGTGNIGKCVAQIFRGFGAKILAYDVSQDLDWTNVHDIKYVDLNTLLKSSDMITLHIPLTPETKHILNAKTLSELKPQAYLINTSRGALINTDDLISSLKSKRLAGAALDVYEEEENLFFMDLSEEIISDDRFSVLNSFPNVLVTSHQAFLTQESMTQISHITLQNALDWLEKKPLSNSV